MNELGSKICASRKKSNEIKISIPLKTILVPSDGLEFIMPKFWRMLTMENTGINRGIGGLLRVQMRPILASYGFTSSSHDWDFKTYCPDGTPINQPPILTLPLHRVVNSGYPILLINISSNIQYGKWTNILWEIFQDYHPSCPTTLAMTEIMFLANSMFSSHYDTKHALQRQQPVMTSCSSSRRKDSYLALIILISWSIDSTYTSILKQRLNHPIPISFYQSFYHE